MEDKTERRLVLKIKGTDGSIMLSFDPAVACKFGEGIINSAAVAALSADSDEAARV